VWSARRKFHDRYSQFSTPELLFFSSSSLFIPTSLNPPRSRTTVTQKIWSSRESNPEHLGLTTRPQRRPFLDTIQRIIIKIYRFGDLLNLCRQVKVYSVGPHRQSYSCLKSRTETALHEGGKRIQFPKFCI
jgi:hypothetical protein